MALIDRTIAERIYKKGTTKGDEFIGPKELPNVGLNQSKRFRLVEIDTADTQDQNYFVLVQYQFSREYYTGSSIECILELRGIR